MAMSGTAKTLACSVAFLSLNCFQIAYAEAATLANWLNRATHVATVSIREGAARQDPPSSECSFQYQVKVNFDLRNGKSLNIISTDAKLTVGGQYLLVIAERSTWQSRSFSSDVPLLPKGNVPSAACKRLSGPAILVRDSEIRPLVEGGLSFMPSTVSQGPFRSTNIWVEFPPLIFPVSSGLTRVSDLDRIALVEHQLNYPPVALGEFYLLSELTGLIKTGEGNHESR